MPAPGGTQDVALEPKCRRWVPLGVLLKIQANLHDVIRGRAERLVSEHSLRLPELEPLLELGYPRMWFMVPGMYGGFRFGLDRDRVEAQVTAWSWSSWSWSLPVLVDTFGRDSGGKRTLRLAYDGS